MGKVGKFLMGAAVTTALVLVTVYILRRISFTRTLVDTALLS